ncbi:MAG: enolase C-terminal domain-like protein [Pirellulaceae bacterium]|jgi:galactonate dehydratase|nr:enolase C-terminal domain-like protein [Pirellulaceae bacterium]
MDRRTFLTTSAAGLACSLGEFALFPEAVLAKIPADLKVTDLKVIPVWTGSMNYIYVKLHTNHGVTGVGEGGIRGRGATMMAAIQEHERYIVGKNPLQIEKHWQAMYRWPRWRGGPILNSAVSAVDIALWDIAGKILDAPVYQLLGGAAKDKMRLYVHGGDADAVRRAKAAGFNAIKTGPAIADNGVIKQPWKLAAEIARLQSMREAGGADFDILYDAHTQFKPEMALEFCRQVEKIRPFFVEEPMLTSDIGKMKWLADHVNVPICQGESQFMKFGLQEMMDRHLVSFINPDVIHAGGISECKKMAAIAEAHFIDVALHNAQSPVMTLAGLHVNACTTNCVIHEFNQARKYAQWEEDLYRGVSVKYANGYAALPTEPGLGIDIDEEVAKKRPARPFARARGTLEWPDGSVSDT